MVETTLENKASILADLWIDYKNDDNFIDFFEYNDLGLPLAYALANGMIAKTTDVETLVGETFALLLAGLGIEDEGFEALDEILDIEE
jgi:hypothetical protein